MCNANTRTYEHKHEHEHEHKHVYGWGHGPMHEYEHRLAYTRRKHTHHDRKWVYIGFKHTPPGSSRLLILMILMMGLPHSPVLVMPAGSGPFT